MSCAKKHIVPIYNIVLQLALLYLFFLPDNAYAQSSPTCKLTTRDVLGPFFEEGAPITTILAPTGEMGSLNTITVQGRVLNINCEPLSNAIVNAWYAGGNPVHYTFPPDALWYRGVVSTDQNGTYSYRATYPGTYSGRPIPHIHYKVISSGKEFVTQLYFQNDVPPSYQDYVSGRQSQFPSEIIEETSGKTLTFDIIMDV